MKKLLLFVMSQDTGTYYVQRGLYLFGYPCKVVEDGYSPAQALIDIFGRRMLYLSGEFPPPALVAETYRDEQGVERHFEYDGEPVVAVYFTPVNLVNFFHNSSDQASLEPDIFVKFFEECRARQRTTRAA